MLKARSSIESLSGYRPPVSNRLGLHLDFNENTAGPSPRVLDAVRGLTASDIATYPDRQPGECAVAEYLGVEPAQVLLTNGIDEALHIISETYLEPGDEVIVPVPTFAMYEIYARATGASLVTIPPEPGFRFPIEQLLSAITPRTKLIALANPNNPTGTVVTNAALAKIAQAAPQAALLVDEAYYDFYGQTILPELDRLPNLI